MESKIKWNEGEGYITATYEGRGDGSAIIISDANEGIDREQTLKVETTDKSISANVLVIQEGRRQPIDLKGGGVFRLNNGGRFGVLKGEAEDDINYGVSIVTKDGLFIPYSNYEDDSTPIGVCKR